MLLVPKEQAVPDPGATSTPGIPGNPPPGQRHPRTCSDKTLPAIGVPVCRRLAECGGMGLHISPERLDPHLRQAPGRLLSPRPMRRGGAEEIPGSTGSGEGSVSSRLSARPRRGLSKR